MAVSVESKSSRVLSLLAFIVTFALFSAVDALTGLPPSPPTTGTTTTPTTPTAAERRCSLDYGGNLTMFNGERTEVKVPCKYRLADFTCGDYRVKVIPGSSVDAEARYFHVTAWVKIVNTVTKETVELTASQSRLKRAESGKLDNAWKIKEGNTCFLDFAGYDGGIARLEKDGVFTVQFSNNSVQVSCVAPDFSSPGVPETLCGDGSTVDEINTARLELFRYTYTDNTQFLQYIILNDTTVTQSKQCVVVASRFQRCQSLRNYTVIKCSHYFSRQSLVQCLTGIGTPLQDAYDFCIRRHCYNDGSNPPDLGNCQG